MAIVTDKHFGANIVMTNDSAKDDSPFVRMLDDLKFSEFRYPGGSVTELATWDGKWSGASMQDVFGDPMKPGEPGYVMTIREALHLCEDQGARITIVVPTKQFYDADTGVYDHRGFDRYLNEMQKALSEFPDVEVQNFEVGNEFWGRHEEIGSRRWTAEEYGKVANIQIPKIVAMSERVAAANGDGWEEPGIGIQAGTAWRANSVAESGDIIDQISMANRGHVTSVFQHSYPNISKTDMQAQTDWAVDAMKVFDDAPGFPADLDLILSEFNVSARNDGDPSREPNQFGNRLAGEWIEEFGRSVDAGIDEIHHWGLQYKWLTNKMYDKEAVPNDHANAGDNPEPQDVRIEVTPLGMVYDLAQQHVIGKSTMTDGEAMAGIRASAGLSVTGFEDANQRVVFVRNQNGEGKSIDVSGMRDGAHVTAYVMTPADKPSTQHDESLQVSGRDVLHNARSEMKVVSGELGKIDIPAEGVLVVTITKPGVGVDIFATDQRTLFGNGETEDVIIGGSGKDILYGGAGRDLIEGGPGSAKDVLHGGGGNDTLRGGDGGDVLISTSGNDEIAAGRGNDLVLASGSADIARVDLGGGGNTLLTSGTRDIRVTGFTVDDDLGLNGVFANREAFERALSKEGDNVRIRLADGKSVVLFGYASGMDGLSDQIFDFRTPEEASRILKAKMDGLRDAQAEYALGEMDDLAHLSGGAHAVPDLDDLALWKTAPDGSETKTGNWPGGVPDPQPPVVPPVSPDPDDEDDGEESPQDKSSGGGGGCFVATAAYGGRGQPEVVALRRFRDDHLIRFVAGRAFIRVYWALGPAVARRVREDNVLGKGIRGVTRPLVAFLRKRGLTSGK